MPNSSASSSPSGSALPSGQPGGGIDDVHDNRRHVEVQHAARLLTQDADQFDPAQGVEDGSDMASGPGLADGEDILGAGDGNAPVEQGLDPVDDVRRQLGLVRQST